MSHDSKHPALTMWSEDEIAFRDAVRSFAEAEIKPHVTHMDEKAEMKPELVAKLFEMGLMGIESPEQFGGAGLSQRLQGGGGDDRLALVHRFDERGL